MELEQMSSAELISLVRRQEQELAEARAAQQGGGEVPQDERAISAAMSEGNKHGVASTVAARIVAAYVLDAALAQRAASVPATGHPKCHKCFGNGETHASFCPLKAASVPAQAGQQPVAWRVGFDLFSSHKEALANVRNPSVEVEPLYTLPAASVQPTAPTDISARLRKLVETLPVPESCANAMRTAADECERFYGGMIAWKETAQQKDRTIIDLRAQLHAPQPDIGRDAALEDDADAYTISVMGKLLADIALTLKGQEKALHRHSYHDLPDLVAELKLAADLATQAAPEVASVPDAEETLLKLIDTVRSKGYTTWSQSEEIARAVLAAANK